MNNKSITKSLVLLIICLCVYSTNAKVNMRVISQKIALNEPLQLVLESDKEIKNYSTFPDIKFFNKGSVSSSTNISVINNKVTKVVKFTQKYYPTKKGTFTIPRFQMKIGSQLINVRSFKVTVVGSKKQNSNQNPFSNFFNNNTQSQEYIDIKADAFFALTTDKKEVYRGEPFTIMMAFYEAYKNKAPINFPKDLGYQIQEIRKQTRLISCWEENSNISSVSPKRIRLNNKAYKQYVIYQSTFFPLTTEDIDIKKVGLKMIKYDVAKRRSFFGRNRKLDHKIFYSKPIHIKVKALPNHPLKDVINVGNYRLVESLEKGTKTVNKTFGYTFKILGEGNINALSDPKIFASNRVFFYDKAQTTNITRENGQVYGGKSFEYFIEIDEAGTYNLADYLYWVYFNFRKEKYDTLVPSKIATVGGQKIVYTDDGDQELYKQPTPKKELIYTANNKLYNSKKSNITLYMFNIFVVLLMSAFGYLFVKNRRSG